jgi:hypothetical protein
MMLENGDTAEDVGMHWTRDQSALSGWYLAVRLVVSETRAASCGASSNDYYRHEAQ